MNCRTIASSITALRASFLISAALSLACGGKDDTGQTSGEETGSADSTSGAGTTTFTATTAESMTTTDPGSTGGESSGGAGSSGGDTGPGFIMEPDGGGASVECDVWAQDCPAGEKCMPWANDGGSSWNATKCSPVDAMPGQVGDGCTVEGSGVSGVDSCDVAMMCYYVDVETNMGTCVAFCGGSMDNPICDPGYVCTIVNDGVLILCRPECDPILQDCEIPNTACLPANGTDQFTCIIDASGDAGVAGDPCEFINACDPGLFCADAAIVPNCQASGCCSEFCDLTAPDPNAGCTQMGQECIAWHEMGMAPPGLEHVGACAIPM